MQLTLSVLQERKVALRVTLGVKKGSVSGM